uniref:Protein kinase domain-containing protein n=1 Tax=Tetradesmus obliquus TaxID=3088 RepID=A0A383W2H5_TETOB|eukprot:jgi/Sobl393_1/1185/SZX71353.1
MADQELIAALNESGYFQHLETLGKGSFGYVVRACRRTADSTQGGGEALAIKLLPRAEVTKYVEAEIVNHSLMRHPHVIQFKEVFLSRRFICIAMEYASGGSLFQYVQRQGRLKEAVARWFFQQLVVGVDYCHRKGVANRDIKLENTLLQDVPRLPLPLVKICDFGYSKAVNKSAAKSKVGTLTYMAPEVLININRDGKYDGKVADIWSCGVMLYVMLCGKYPFDSPNATGVIAAPNDFISILERMVGRQYRFPPDASISAECIDLLQQMLLPEPHRRITVEGIMAHPWFNTNLPPEASSMNATYLGAAPPAGVLAPEAIHKLIEEARMPSNSCKVDPAASPQQQAAVVMQLVAEEQAMQQQACSMPYTYQQQQQQQMAVPMQCQSQQPEPAHVRGAAAPAAAYQQQQPAMGAALPHLLQQQQVMLLQRLQEQQWQQQGQAQQQQQQQHPGLLHTHERNADVDDETLMMIDTAITAQMGGGPGTASADLQAYLAGAAGKLQN